MLKDKYWTEDIQVVVMVWEKEHKPVYLHTSFYQKLLELHLLPLVECPKRIAEEFKYHWLAKNILRSVERNGLPKYLDAIAPDGFVFRFVPERIINLLQKKT